MNQKIAMIGSAYKVKNELNDTKISELLLNYPLHPKMLALVKQIHSLIPHNYTGVHMWFKDHVDFDCNDTESRAAYNHVLQELQDQPSSTILIGQSHAKAALCLKHFTADDYEILTVNDIVKKHRELEAQMKEINLPQGTLFILLDQLLVALGSRIVLDSTSFYKHMTSTFQALIQKRHNQKSSMQGWDWPQWWFRQSDALLILDTTPHSRQKLKISTN